MTSGPIAFGTLNLDRVTANDHVVNTQVRNPLGVLKLGGRTSTNSAVTYLAVESKLDGVHLTEATGTTILIDSPLTTTAACTSSGNQTMGGNLAVGGTLTVSGAATLQSTLATTGAATFSSTVSTGALTAASSSITGNETVGGTFRATGATTLASTLAVSQAASFQSTVTTGALTASALSVTGNASIGGTLGSTGAATLSSTLSVSGATSLASTLGVTGATTVTTLSASGNASITGTLAVTGTSALTGALTVASNVTVNGSTGLTVPTGKVTVGSASLAYDSGASAAYVQLGSTNAVKVFASDNHVEIPGGLITGTVTGYPGNVLTLKGGDALGTVHIAGNLALDGDINKRNVNSVEVEDLTISVARTSDANGNNTSTDPASDGAGLVVEGNSAYPKNLLWRYNQGLAYAPPDTSHYTGDGLSYWQVQGGNLVLTRTIPAANHISYNYSQKAWVKDNTAATVSYALRINDLEELELVKSQGIDYSAGNNSTQVGSQAKVLTTWDIPPTTDGTTT